jgi:phospholipase C
MMRTVLALALALASSSATLTHEEYAAEVERLRDTMHTLTREEQDRRLEQVRSLMPELKRTHQDKVENFVVLFMENRAADHTFGCMLGDHPEFDGIPSTGHSVPADPNNASAGMVNVTCGGAEFVCKGGNSMSLWDSHFKDPKDAGEYPYGEQDDKYSGLTGATTVSMHAFNATQLPIKKAISEEFGVFNKYFSSTPTASTPNHLYAQSATSCGLKDNELYNACGGPTPNFPQMTIYDNLYLNNVSFGIYYNSTCGEDGNQTECQEKWSGGSVYVGSPDLAMMGVARHVENFEGQETFYEQAAKGTLPSFSFFTPPDEAW